MNYAERMERHDRLERTLKLAGTYLRKAEHYLYAYRGFQDEIIEPESPPSSSYWTLLDQTLVVAFAIIEKLPDSFFESAQVEDYFGLREHLGDFTLSKFNSSDQPLELAEKVVAALTTRRERTNVKRKIMALENPDGRTPEENEAFKAKARELRERHGIGVDG